MRPDQPIVRSAFEDDLYKLTMLFYFWMREKTRKREDEAEYEFICRNKPIFPLSELIPEIEAEVEHLCTLSPTYAEIDDLHCRDIFPIFHFPEFASFLRGFRLSRQDIEIRKKNLFEIENKLKANQTAHPNCDLVINVKGALTKTTRFEIPILYIVNELYFRRVQKMWGMSDESVRADYLNRLQDKCDEIKAICKDGITGEELSMNVIDFGLRRRYSGAIQEAGLQFFADRNWKVPGINLVGVSNVHLARKFGIKAYGTVAHEFFTAHQAFYRDQLGQHQTLALEGLLSIFDGRLRATLTDTVTTRVFLRDLNVVLAKMLEGFRHDSDDPIKWAKAVLQRLTELGQDPKTKNLMFSDGLTFLTAFKIFLQLIGRCTTSYGIGTSFTNDMPWTNHTPLNIVMKLVKCNGLYVAKISDTPGKILCLDRSYLAELTSAMRIEI